MKRGMHARMCAHTRAHSTSAQGGISKLLLQSKKLDTEECSVVHLCEIQELANLTMVIEIRIIITSGKLLNELTEKGTKNG